MGVRHTRAGEGAGGVLAKALRYGPAAQRAGVQAAAVRGYLPPVGTGGHMAFPCLDANITHGDVEGARSKVHAG